MFFGKDLNSRGTEMPETVYLMVDSSQGSRTTPGVSEKFKALKIVAMFSKTQWAVTVPSLKVYQESSFKRQN